MKINIVIDNKNSWFHCKVARLIKKIKEAGHKCNLYSGQEKIQGDSDITFFLSCEKYITTETRQKSTYNIVIHASNLPHGKGMSPTTWQILEGKNKIPVTLFEVADKFDAGNYYLKDSFMLDGTELINEWQEKLYQCIERMATKFIKDAKKLKPIKQKGESTVYKRRKPEDSELDIDKPLKSQFNLLRIVDNDRYPAFFNHKDNIYVVKIYKQ